MDVGTISALPLLQVPRTSLAFVMFGAEGGRGHECGEGQTAEMCSSCPKELGSIGHREVRSS